MPGPVPCDARGADHPRDLIAILEASRAALEAGIEASSSERLESLESAVARHLDRFAFREAPLGSHWTDALESA